MADCCDPISYRRLFNSKEARRNLKTFQRKGLDPMASSLVEYLTDRGVEDSSVLEVGGGVGAAQIELLRAGAARATNVELSAGYEEVALRLATLEGVDDRVTRRVGDFVEEADRVDSADVVVMNRVICCYPWMNRMMSAAVSKADRYLALTFPRDRWFVRTALGIGNGYMAAKRCGFRAFVHSPEEIESVATNAGLAVAHRDNDRIWHALVLERVA